MGVPISHSCPKCAKPLEAGGEIQIRGKPARLFLCPACTIAVRAAGRVIQTPFIYAVDEAGEVWDAARIADER